MMKVLVCVKQVPETGSAVGIDQATPWVRVGDATTFRMNRFDECAVETAVQIKEQLPGTRIHILSVGPARSEAVIRRAIGMGADHGTHIVTSSDGFVDPSTLAGWMASLPEASGADLIFCGAMSEDLMQGQVGPLMAEFLSLPCATAVVQVNIMPAGEEVHVEREIEGGYREAVALRLPALLTIQTGINRPRYPSLSKLLRANRLELQTPAVEGMDTSPPLQSVAQVTLPGKLREGIVLEGSTSQKAEQLVAILSDRSFLL
jgi:electron transfer flavoprotein beta subunit